MRAWLQTHPHDPLEELNDLIPILREKHVPSPGLAEYKVYWVAVKELKLSYHNGSQKRGNKHFRVYPKGPRTQIMGFRAQIL